MIPHIQHTFGGISNNEKFVMMMLRKKVLCCVCVHINMISKKLNFPTLIKYIYKNKNVSLYEERPKVNFFYTNDFMIFLTFKSNCLLFICPPRS